MDHIIRWGGKDGVMTLCEDDEKKTGDARGCHSNLKFDREQMMSRNLLSGDSQTAPNVLTRIINFQLKAGTSIG